MSARSREEEWNKREREREAHAAYYGATDAYSHHEEWSEEEDQSDERKFRSSNVTKRRTQRALYEPRIEDGRKALLERSGTLESYADVRHYPVSDKKQSLTKALRTAHTRRVEDRKLLDRIDAYRDSIMSQLDSEVEKPPPATVTQSRPPVSKTRENITDRMGGPYHTSGSISPPQSLHSLTSSSTERQNEDLRDQIVALKLVHLVIPVLNLEAGKQRNVPQWREAVMRCLTALSATHLLQEGRGTYTCVVTASRRCVSH